MKKVIALALSLTMMLSFAACESKTEEVPAETPAAPVETPAATTETPAAEETVVDETVDEAKIVEAVKAANGKVADIAFADADAEMTVTITMAADASEEDVNAAMDAFKAEITDEFVANNLFHKTEEKMNKAMIANFVLEGSSDVAYTADATYSAGPGRSGMLYTRTVAWSAPEAPAAA